MEMTAPLPGTSAPSQGLGQLFLTALMVFALGTALAVLLRVVPAGAWWLPLLAGSGVAAMLVWRGLHWPDGWTRYLSFGAVLLLACVINRMLYVADMLIVGDGYLDWPFSAANPQLSIMKAEIATFLGTLLTVFAWLYAGGATYSPGSVLHAPPKPLLRLLATTYIASLLALAVSVLAPQLVQVSGQLLPTLLVLGSTTAFFLPYLLSGQRLVRLALVLVMGLPFIYVSLGTGMKENVILALAPTGYMLWNYSRGRGARLALALTAILAIALVTAYISFFRSEVWYANRAVDQSQVFGDFVTSVESQGIGATAAEGWTEFLSRNNAAPGRGWAVSIADSDGYQPGLAFAPMLYVFVPRAVWPEKPPVRQGWEYSGLVFGAEYMAWSDSSLSAGFYSGLYLGQGWLAVILGAIGVGLLMAGLTRAAYRLGGPVLSGLFMLSLLPYALRLDEAWTVGAFSGPLINFIYICALFLVARFVARLAGGGRETA